MKEKKEKTEQEEGVDEITYYGKGQIKIISFLEHDIWIWKIHKRVVNIFLGPQHWAFFQEITIYRILLFFQASFQLHLQTLLHLKKINFKADYLIKILKFFKVEGDNF